MATLSLDEFLEEEGPDELLMVLLRSLGPDAFTADRVSLHEAIRKLQDDSQFAGLFDEFVFNLSGPYPFSSELDDSITRLRGSTLEMTNPRMRQYRIRDKNAVDRAYRKCSVERRKLLEAAGRAFAKEITCQDEQ